MMLNSVIRSIVAASFVVSTAITPALSDPARQAEISRMEGLLAISCDPVLDQIKKVVETGQLYRKIIVEIESSFATEKKRFAGFLGDFSLPVKAPDGLSFRFFTEFTKLRTDAANQGLLAPNVLPSGPGLGPLAAIKQRGPFAFADGKDGLVKLTPDQKLLLEAADEIFVLSNSEEEAEFFRKRRENFEDRFAALKQEYKKRRLEYEKAYSVASVKQLNSFYQDRAVKRINDARNAYRFEFDKLRDIAVSREFEHCLGEITAEDEAISIAAGNALLADLYQRGADNTLTGIPGMGFNLSAKANTTPFEEFRVPEFPYTMNLKRDSFTFSQFQADLNIIKSKASFEVMKQYALFLKGTKWETQASMIFQAGDATNGVLADSAKAVGNLMVATGKGIGNVGVDLVKNGFNPLAMIAMMELNRVDITQQRDINATLSGEIEKGIDVIVGAYNAAAEKMDQTAEKMALGLVAYDQLKASGFTDENGVLQMSKFDDLSNLPPSERLAVSERLVDLTSTMEQGMQTFADVSAAFIAIYVEEALTMGLSRAASSAGKLLATHKATKAATNLHKASQELRAQARGNSFAAKQAGKKLAEVEAELKKVEQARKAQESAVEDVARLSKGGPDGAGPLDETRKVFAPGEGIDEGKQLQNLGTFKGPNGERVRLQGQELAVGGNAQIFIDPENPNKVIRLTPFREVDAEDFPLDRIETTRRENISRDILEKADIEGMELLLPEAKVTDLIGLDNDGKKKVLFQVQIVDRVVDASKQVKAQGGKMTIGQAAALKKMKESMVEQGIINTDGTLGNFTFINKGGDNWTIGIIDPGGFEKVPNIKDAALIQAAFDRGVQKAAEDGFAGANALVLGLALTAGDGPDFSALLKRNGFKLPDFQGQTQVDKSLKQLLLKLSPEQYPEAVLLEGQKDISARVNALEAAKDAVVDGDKKLEALNNKAAKLADEAAALSSDKQAAQKAAEELTEARRVKDAKTLEALQDLGEANSIRPGAVADALLSITGPARKSMLVAGQLASAELRGADCIRLRSELVSGDASEDTRKLAAEKCGLVVAGAQNGQAQPAAGAVQ